MKISIFSNTGNRFSKHLQLKYLLLVTLALTSLGAMSSPQMASKQQVGIFKNSTLCVVLEDGTIAYNVFIKAAVEKYWKSTDYEFISQQEFATRHFDSKYSFLVIVKGVYDRDPSGVSYNILSLVLGDESTDLTNMPELCSFPISYRLMNWKLKKTSQRKRHKQSMKKPCKT